MRKFKYNKLVRDRTIENRQKEGSVFYIKKLNDQEFAAELKKKFMEEANEVFQAKNNTELIEELADVLEVITAICDVNKFNFDDILKAKAKKHQERGGFESRNFIISAEHPEGSYIQNYCLNNPDKYPEITD